MKDERGLYYLPSMQDTDTRMYVRSVDGVIQFRLWNANHAEVWDRHEWLPFDVIEAAAEMYKERGAERNPLALYDVEIAKRLIKDEAN
ncbi:hypothetical protein SAMN02745704_01551 [Paucidesulfovibrio gracilis DSM 16080]|uniref:Uncharacterized protein n=1 Tax=Paucidesulfovibrio gracilis DSM 16080 TaxID=1121449 RepID=A0A1T4WYL6_9BACT|nr:hypothetical protein [Paucidesulfovibrio gracilis]SKA82404.1 hypothetical protein SAMN02745704_01551 [Paucidesulfovibrio gracilis DSM 16080]